jgi:hypothetical protein
LIIKYVGRGEEDFLLFSPGHHCSPLAELWTAPQKVAAIYTASVSELAFIYNGLLDFSSAIGMDPGKPYQPCAL